MSAEAFRDTLRIDCDPGQVPAVRDFIARAVQHGGFPGHLRNRVQIAVDEAVTNIIEHGYPHAEDSRSTPTTGHIDLAIASTPAEIRIEIVDTGQQFDPRATSLDLDIAAHVASGRTGGLGVFLMRKIMDVVDYHAEAGRGNRLILIKRA